MSLSIRYAVVHMIKLESLGLSPQIVSGEIKDIKQAEKARIGYLDLWPTVSPLNVSVVQYAV